MAIYAPRLGLNPCPMSYHAFGFFFIYMRREKYFLRLNTLLVYGHIRPALGSESLTQGP